MQLITTLGLYGATSKALIVQGNWFIKSVAASALCVSGVTGTLQLSFALTTAGVLYEPTSNLVLAQFDYGNRSDQIQTFYVSDLNYPVYNQNQLYLNSRDAGGADLFSVVLSAQRA
jgi:hypothetical protein